MGFDSAGYYFFLFGVFCLLWLWRPHPRLLLAASLVFYASFDWRLVPLLAGEAWLAWAGAFRLAKSRSKAELAGLLALVFAPLFLWKVYEAGGGGLAFPLGLSFFTFHCASYLIDSYRGAWKPERSYGDVLLYLAFFPQLVAGPITRAKEIFPQLARLERPSGPEARRACWRIYLGLLKKLAIANALGVCVKAVLEAPGIYHGALVLLMLALGRYYVYADFSGYTDIAIGSGRLLGITLPENFRRPFAAPSIAEYWRRWHISLSTWIRDYLFFPLAASPLSRLGTYPLLVLTFLALGAWHGFSANFLLYGLWHGLFLAAHDATREARRRLWRGLGVKEHGFAERWVFPWATYLLVVSPPTALFLTGSLGAAGEVARQLLATEGEPWVHVIPRYRVVSAALTILALEAYQYAAARIDVFAWYEARPAGQRQALAAGAGLWLAYAAYVAAGLDFLYFRF